MSGGNYDYLYNGTQKAYEISKAFDDFTTIDSGTFSSKFNVDDYMKPLSISNAASGGESFFTRFPAVSPDPQWPSYTPNVTNYKPNGSFYMQLNTTSSSSLSTTEWQRLYNAINANMAGIMSQTTTASLQTYMETLSVSQLFTLYNQYIDTFNNTVGNFKFKQLLDVYITYIIARVAATSGDTKTMNTYLMNAANQINIFTTDMFAAVRDAAKATVKDIYNIYSDKPQRFYLLIRAMKSITSMSQTATLLDENNVAYTRGPTQNLHWYTIFAGNMVNKIVIPQRVTSDESMRALMKVIATEMYIKSSYHIIVYDVLSELTNIYRMNGDYVNARLGLLAQTLFMYQFLDKMRDAAPDSLSNKTTVETLLPTAIEQFLTMVSRPYLDPNQSSADVLFSETVKKLRDLSNETQSSSESVEVLRNSIKKNQLTLQSTTAANAANAGRTLWASVEMYALLVVLLVVLISCSILFFMDRVFIGICIAGIVSAIVLIYLFVRMLLQFV
jgi:hypothetical protein